MSTSNPNGNVFRDSQGRWRTQSLFHESSYSSSSPDAPLYTMKPEDLPPSHLYPTGLPSFSRLYLELRDPWEYKQATTLMGGWEHWQVLCESKWFSDYILPLREELEIKLRSEGAIKVAEIMNSESRNTLVAAKYMADGLFRERKAGRPSKAAITAEARKQAELQRRVQDDAKRLGLKIVS